MTLSQVGKILQGITATVGVGFILLMSLPFLPFTGAIELFSVRSGSMEPALPTGSLIFVRSASEYRVGDIVTVQTTSDKTVTHRIVEVHTTDVGVAFLTKGDNNEEPDPVEVVPTNIIGKTFLMLPLLGYPVAYAQTQNGFLMLIVIPATLIILGELLTISREARRLWQRWSRTQRANEVSTRNITFAPMSSAAYPLPAARVISTPPPKKRIV